MIQLKRNLEHQLEPVEKVIKVFNDVDFKREKTFMNPIFNLDSSFLKDNLNKLVIDGLEMNMNYLNLDIKMETGTGKTYVYVDLIHRLHEEKGVNKFIILVPGNPIKAGTEQFIEASYVRKHFRERYIADIDLYTLDPASKKSKKSKEYFPSAVADFVKASSLVSNKISVLLINSQMLISKSLQKDYEQLIEGYSNPLKAIAAVSPFVIIDEPHRFDKKNKTYNYMIENIQPSVTIRLGATFPESTSGKEYSNLLYNLDSNYAFNNNLVKGVAVEFLPQVSKIDSSIKLISTDSKNKTANLRIEKDGRTFTEKINEGTNLSKFNLDFGSINVEQIKKDELILSNGRVLSKSDKLYSSIYSSSYQEMMIELALVRHFETEEKLFARENKIKSLALFFIDSKNSYRNGKEKGYLAEAFERILKKILNQKIMQYKDNLLNEEYLGYLKASLKDIEKTHLGYFYDDLNSSDQVIQEQVQAILKDKNMLLSIKNHDGTYNTRRFIFSKWTLREGWDNPNIFTIAKLRSSGSDNSKRQEVGRGLRLPVDELGNRIDNEDFYLNFIIDFSEEEFASELIEEIQGDNGNIYALKANILNSIAQELNMTVDKAKGMLMYKGYIDNDLNIYQSELQNFKNEFPNHFSELNRNKVVNRNKETIKEINIRNSVYVELQKEWESLNTKYYLSYGELDKINLTDELVKIILKLDNSANVVESVRKITSKEKEEIRLIDATGTVTQSNQIMKYNEFLLRIQKTCNIPLATMHDVFIRVSKKIKISNSYFTVKLCEEFIRRFNDYKIKSFLTQFSYEKLNVSIHPTALTEKDGSLKSVLVQGRVGKYISDGDVPSNYLYDICAYDSDLEKKNIMLDNIQNVEVFAKIPTRSLRIPTVIGESYSPDFIYLVTDNSGNKKLNLVIETKDVESIDDLRGIEEIKNQCAIKFFDTLKNHGVPVTFTRQLKNDKLYSIINDVLK